MIKSAKNFSIDFSFGIKPKSINLEMIDRRRRTFVFFSYRSYSFVFDLFLEMKKTSLDKSFVLFSFLINTNRSMFLICCPSYFYPRKSSQLTNVFHCTHHHNDDDEINENDNYDQISLTEVCRKFIIRNCFFIDLFSSLMDSQRIQRKNYVTIFIQMD